MISIRVLNNLTNKESLETRLSSFRIRNKLDNNSVTLGLDLECAGQFRSTKGYLQGKY